MALSTWLLAGSAIIGLLIIVIGIIVWVRNHTNEGVPDIDLFVTNWSLPQRGPDPTRNTCKTYDFPGSIVAGNFYPGNPTFDANILDGITPSNSIPPCIDIDQLIAVQQSHSCQRNGRLDAVCKTIDGIVVGEGYRETYYTSNGCANIGLCPGQLSLLIPNYMTGDLCINSNGTGPISMETCDPIDQSQLIRITRVNMGVNPNGKKAPNNNGVIGRIYDRANNLCLTPSTQTQTITVDKSQYSGCSGFTSITGRTLGFANCNTNVPTGLYPGYTWGFISSIFYCPDVNGCTTTTYSVPPQIVYLGDLDIASYPTTGSYQGLTGSNAIIKWLLDQNAMSIQYGGQSVPVLAPMQIITFVNGIPLNGCDIQPSIIQYQSITGYNTNKNLPVCIAGVPDLFQNCVPL